MKTILEPQDIESIALRVVELIKPLLSNNARQEKEDIIFDKKGLSQYLHISESNLNKLVSNKQIPFFKMQAGQSGGVRFYKRDIDRWIQRKTTPDIQDNSLKLSIAKLS